MNPEIGKIQTWDGKEKEMETKVRIKKREVSSALTPEQKVMALAAKYIAANNKKREEGGYPPSSRFHSIYCRIGGMSFYAALRQFGLEETYKSLLETGKLTSFPVRGGYLVGQSLTDDDKPTKAPKKAPTLEEFLAS